MISRCPAKGPNLGPALMQTFSDVFAHKYALLISVPHASIPFNSPRKMHALRPFKETTPEYTAVSYTHLTLPTILLV